VTKRSFSWRSLLARYEEIVGFFTVIVMLFKLVVFNTFNGFVCLFVAMLAFPLALSSSV
jgi:hypothetical protein